MNVRSLMKWMTICLLAYLSILGRMNINLMHLSNTMDQVQPLVYVDIYLSTLNSLVVVAGLYGETCIPYVARILHFCTSEIRSTMQVTKWWCD